MIVNVMESIAKKCNLTDSEKKILMQKFPRNFSKEEQERIDKRLKKIAPQHLFFNRTYNDKVIDFLANPLTRTLMFTCYTIVIILILKELEILKFIFYKKYIEFYFIAIIILAVVLYHHQRNINDNTMWMMQRLPEGATYGDYLKLEPKVTSNKPIFSVISSVMLTATLAGIIDLTKKNPMLTALF